MRAHGLGVVLSGEPGFRLTSNPDTVRAPDVAFSSHARLAAVGPVQGCWPGVPALIVEVVSPHDLYADLDDKIAAWLEHGARLVFAVNPRRRTVAVHRPGQPARILGPDDQLDGEDVVPGWTLLVRDLFA